MTDVTQGQDAPAPAATAAGPDVDDLFPKQDVDDLFPANYKPTDQAVRNVSPIQDMIFSNPGRSHARVLDAFGYGFKQGWGAAPQEFSEADEALRKAGIYNDYAKGQHSIIKAANEAVMRPAVSALLTAKGVLGGLMSGGQAAVAQEGAELGAPNLGREIAAVPEAFPTGLHQPAGIPHLPEPIAEAKSLDVIGAGEQGYFGTAPVTPESVKTEAAAAKAQDAAKPEELPGHQPDAAPSPVAQPVEAPEAPAAPDIHAVARTIAPETFSEFDALSQKKDTFRRWIDELREVRDQTARENAPHASEIADLQTKLQEATPRLAKKYNERLAPLMEEHDAYVAEQTARDSADMAKVRQQLMEADYRQRDLAPDVAKAYREAEQRMPQAEATETPPAQATANEPAPAEVVPAQVPATGEAAVEPVAASAAASVAAPTEVKPAAPPEAAAPSVAAQSLPIAHAPSIVADVAQKLKAAGRPAEEADAAAQVVAAYWETRSTRFDGAKGTAAEMYAREAPDIVAGKEKPSKPSKTKKARELELAQRTKSFEQSAQTPAFQEWFGDSKVVDADGAPRVVYHGTASEISAFDKSKLGSSTGAPSAEKGFFFTSDPNVAGSYAAGSNAYKDVPFLRFINKATGGLYERFNEKLLKATAGRSAISSGENIVPAYLSLKNPMEIDFHGDEYRERSFADLIDQAKADGHDGVLFRNAVDPGFKGGEAPSDVYVAFEPNQIKSATGNRGTFDPNSDKIYEQGVKGRIRVRDDARNTITLMKNADASTFIHETGHDWLERMLDDARDEQAPQILKSDAETVLKWLGVDSPEGVKTRHHEKFARSFETYMMEGRAPSQGLAKVFAKFRDWLTTIYRTVSALKAPISDDIRGVFDRLLAEKPEKTVIAPEREIKGGLAEKHEALAETVPNEHGFEVANTIEAERDSHAARNLVEKGDNDSRFADTGAEAEGRAAGNPQPPGDANATQPVSREAGAAGGPREVGEGGSEAEAEGHRARQKYAGAVTKPTPLLQFIASRGGISAGEELISDLRQVLGGKNRYIPGHGQLIRTEKQVSTAAKRAGRFGAQSLDKAREAAVEAGLLPEGATVRDLLDRIDDEVRGLHAEREVGAEENAHAEHSFVEGINDAVKQAGGTELTEAERARALELHRTEGLNDPHDIIERLALEARDEEPFAPEVENVPGWDQPAPGWDEIPDDSRAASEGGGNAAPAESGEPRGATARTRSDDAEPVDATVDLPKSETQLIDKAGNIRLDNLGTGEDVNAVIRATAEDNNEFIEARRGVLPDAEVLKLADALGMDAEKIADRKLGQAYNAEQIVAARKLLIQSAANVRDLAAKIAGGTEADVLAFAEARARHLMIQEQVSGITAEAGRALRAFRSLPGSKEAEDISAFLKNTQGRTLYQMKEDGALLAMMDTPQQVSKAVHEKSLTRWQKTRAGTLSWFINNLISGPITHAGYSVGNTVTQLFKATVDTSVAAAMGALRDAPAGERVYFGEVGAQLYGMVRGMRDGYSPAVTALKTGVPFMKGDVEGLIGQIEAAHRPQAIPGAIGYVMETPSRAVTAIHTMHYSMNYEAEIARRAFRSAVGEGLDPGSTGFNTKVADLTQSPPKEMMEAAHDEALKMVLMKRTQFGTAQYHLQKAVNSNILAKIVMPFMQVGANILHESFIERTPLGAMSPTVRDNLMGKNGTVAQHTQASRIAVGIGVSTAVIGLTAEGILTGGGPSDPKQMAIKEMTGWRPYSIKVGESYVPYRKYLGGLGPLIAGTADMYEVGHALNEEGLTKAAAASLFGFAEVIADESWAKGLSNFIDAARHWDRDGGRYLRNLGADFIPFSIGLSQVTNLSDPYRREVRTMLDVARAHIPGMSQGLFPVRDIWGEPILSHTALGPSTANHDPATQALLDAGYYPGKLERKIRGVELTDQQYDDFTRMAGRMARMRMNALVNTPGLSQMPKQIQAEKIKDIIESARESARSMIMMQSANGPNDIMVKAAQAKRAKVTGETVH